MPPNPQPAPSPRRSILRGTLAALLLGLPGSLHAITDLDLLPWGAAAGDSNTMTFVDSATQTANGGLDDGYALVSLAGRGPAGTALPITFYGSSYNRVYVDSNGLLSFTQGVSTWLGQHFPISPSIGPLIAGYWGDVDTRTAGPGGKPVIGSNSGLLWYRTASDTATLNEVAAMISAGFAGQVITGGQPSGSQTAFTPTVVQVATWDHVGSYNNHVLTSSTFQIIVASDGVQSYTLFLYPQQEQNWLLGDVSNNTPPQAGFDAGDGVHYFDAIGTQTAAMSQSWQHTNTLPAKAGVQIFRIDSGANGTLNLTGAATTTSITDTRTYTLNLAASGNTFTSSIAGSALQFDTLNLPTGGNVNFTGNLVALTGPNSHAGITQGDLNFTDTTVLALRGTNTVTGAALHLAKSAQVQLYNSSVTTAATTLSFDNSGGGSGGTLDLRGFDTTLGAINSLTAGSGIITNSSTTPSALTLDTGAATSSTFSGQILKGGAGSGDLSLIKNGPGTLTLAGSNTHTGPSTLNAGATILAHQNALQASTAVLNGGSLVFDAGVTGKAFTLGGLAGSGDLTLANNATTPQPIALTVGGNGASTIFSGNLGGSGSLTKTGAGTLTLAGTNSYGGPTNITAGGVQFAKTVSLYNSTGAALNAAVTAANFTVQTGATATFNTGGTGEFSPIEITTLAALGSFKSNSTLGLDTTNAAGSVTFTAPLLTSGGNTTALVLNKLGAGTMALGASDILNTNWRVTATAGAIDLGSFNQTVAGLQLAGGNLTGGTGTLTSNSAYDLRSGTIGAALAGNVAVNKTTTGAATLSGANSYSGITTISAGTLQFAKPAALYNSTTAALSGAVTAPNLVVQSGAIAAFNLGGTGEFTQPEIAALASLTGFQSGSFLGLDTSNAPGSVILTTPLVSPNSGATALGLAKLGAGTLALGANNVIGSSFTVAVAGGTLDLVTFTDTVAGFQLTGGTLTGGSSGVLTSTTAYDLRAGTISGTLGGAVALNKTTADTVTLAHAGTYTGGTNLNAGVLNISAANALGATGAIAFNGGTLQYSAGSTQDYSARFSTAANQQFRFDTNGQNATLASALTSTGGSLTKLGPGALTISGAARHTGATSVLGGTLLVSGSLNGTTGVTVGDGLHPAILAGNGIIIPGESGVVLIKNGATLAPTPGATSLTLAPTTGTVAAGSYTGNAALEFESGATFQLSLANSQAATNGAPATADYSRFALAPSTSAELDGLLDILLTGPINDGDVFPVLLGTAGTLLGTFANAPDLTTFTSHGRYWEINYQWNNTTAQAGVSEASFLSTRGGSNIALFAIPEPGSFPTFLLAGGALLLIRPRRSRQ